MSVSDDRGRTTEEGGSPVLRNPPSVVRPLVRGVCPGLTAPMSTGDGLLVRLMPTGPIPLDAFIAFCTAARQHGNGTLEISARGSLQVRGLTPQSAPIFASTVAALGIEAADGVPVIESPLGGDDPDALLDAARLAADLRRALGQARLPLAAKVSVALDGGGRLHLDALSADVRLRAVGPADRPRLCIGLGGDGRSATWLGTIAPPRAPDVVVGLLTMIASHGPAARAADVLRTSGMRAFHSIADIGIEPAPAPPPRLPAETIGLHPLRDGTLAVGIALAFVHAHADALAELASVAAADGARSLRTAPGRTLLLVGVAAANAAAVTSAAGQLGLVTQAFDLRRRIAACPGAPACASGLIPARALAAALVPALAPELAPNPWAAPDTVTIHISGCSKGCAHPASAALTVVGTERGCGIIRHGSARAAPRYHVDPAGLAAEVARIVAESGEAAHG
jgi:precorrin-3B synthase